MTAPTTQPIDLAAARRNSRSLRKLTWKGVEGFRGKLDDGQPMTAKQAEEAVRRDWTVVKVVWLEPDRFVVTVRSMANGAERQLMYKGAPAVVDPHAAITEFEKRLATGKITLAEGQRIVNLLRAAVDLESAGEFGEALEELLAETVSR